MLIYSQDAFKDNFLVQWLPETLGMEHIAPSRPRVYLIDFEVAVHFDEDLPPEQCVCQGPPMGGSFPGSYGRRMPPEVASGAPYDPFKLDVWQLGISFADFKASARSSLSMMRCLTDDDAEYDTRNRCSSGIDDRPESNHPSDGLRSDEDSSGSCSCGSTTGTVCPSSDRFPLN